MGEVGQPTPAHCPPSPPVWKVDMSAPRAVYGAATAYTRVGPATPLPPSLPLSSLVLMSPWQERARSGTLWTGEVFAMLKPGFLFTFVK